MKAVPFLHALLPWHISAQWIVIFSLDKIKKCHSSVCLYVTVVERAAFRDGSRPARLIWLGVEQKASGLSHRISGEKTLMKNRLDFLPSGALGVRCLHCTGSHPHYSNCHKNWFTSCFYFILFRSLWKFYQKEIRSRSVLSAWSPGTQGPCSAEVYCLAQAVGGVALWKLTFSAGKSTSQGKRGWETAPRSRQSSAAETGGIIYVHKTMQVLCCGNF